MKNFNDILLLIDTLLGENGCAWDKKQTIFSLKNYILEEAQEVSEAVDLKDKKKIKEEIGDLLYTSLFLAKVGSIDIDEITDSLHKKMVRRHPHIFGNENCKDIEDIEKMWKRIKKEEKAP